MAKGKKQTETSFNEEILNENLNDVQLEVGEIQKPELPQPVEKEIVLASPKFTPTKQWDSSLSFEDRIKAFLNNSTSGDFIRMNDFLKSLYGIPTSSAINKWLLPGEMKSLGHTLKQMQDKGEITIRHDAHLKLGKHFYAGEDRHQEHYNLQNLVIEGKK